MNHILQAITVVVPILFVLILGFSAQKVKAFGPGGTAISSINELVLKFALPASLFFATVSVKKADLINDLDLFYVLLVVILIGYFIGFFAAKLLFKRNIVEAAIAGLAVAFSAGPFYGPALLDGIYGNGSGSGVSVSIISIILNVVAVPLTTIIIKVELSRQKKQEESVFKMVGKSLFDAIFKTPFVWAPLLAFILVFVDIKMPEIVLNSLDLIGKATAGAAVFVAGMTIAENKFKFTPEVGVISILKNIGLPLLFVGIALLFKMQPSTDIFNQGLLLAALPSGPMIVLLATRYKAYQQEASSILATSTVAMIVTVTALVAILNI